MMPAVPRSVQVAADRSRQLGLPEISVTPSAGRLLMMLAQLTHAMRVLEIGTLGGYSTAWMAEGLAPGGRVTTIEVDAARAAAAVETFRLGDIGERVDVRHGTGLGVLASLRAERAGPFDLVFIDADKENSPNYFEAASMMTRPGGVIVIDNVVRHGEIADASSKDANVIGSREAIRRAGQAPGVSTAVLQTVGTKGYDGMVIAMVGRAQG